MWGQTCTNVVSSDFPAWHNAMAVCFVWLVGYLTSSPKTLTRPKTDVWQFFVPPHTRQSGKTMTSVSAGHFYRPNQAGSGIELMTSSPEIARSTDWATTPYMLWRARARERERECVKGRKRESVCVCAGERAKWAKRSLFCHTCCSVKAREIHDGERGGGGGRRLWRTGVCVRVGGAWIIQLLILATMVAAPQSATLNLIIYQYHPSKQDCNQT